MKTAEQILLSAAESAELLQLKHSEDKYSKLLSNAIDNAIRKSIKTVIDMTQERMDSNIMLRGVKQGNSMIKLIRQHRD